MRALRLTVVAILAIFEVACFFIAIVTWEVPSGIYGWNVGTDGRTVINVEPDSPAARAGVEPGDELVYTTLPSFARVNVLLNEGVRVGRSLTVQIRHAGGLRSVTLESQEIPSLNDLSNVVYALGATALGLVGLALLVLRPSRMTWGSALIAAALAVPASVQLWAQQAPIATAATYQATEALLYGLQVWGLMTFAARFPSDKPYGFTLFVDRLALPAGLASTAIFVYVGLAIFVLPSPPGHWVMVAYDYGTTAFAAFCAMAAFVATYVRASRSERSRLGPVIFSFLLLIVAQALQQFVEQITSNFAIYLACGFFFSFSALLVAAAIAYGVIRHRVIDVTFIVSRTLVYTILTVFVVAIFALIEYVIGKLLERGRLAEMLEVAAAVGVGVSMNYLHGGLDKFLDVVLFRRRHEAEQRLARTARTLPHATAIELVDDMLVAEPSDALGLASAAIFRHDDGRYVRTASNGWSGDMAAALDANDHLVLRLRAELQPLGVASLRWPREDVPGGDAQPTYAVPVVIGHQLEAIALYGAHAGGEDLDPDERKMLRGLVGGAALAYDHLTEQELRRDVERLRTENETLRAVERKLTEVIESSIGRKAGGDG